MQKNIGVAMKEKTTVNNMDLKSSSPYDWKKKIPLPICEDVPDYDKLYQKAWELAHDHIRYIDGMPQSPYMDEAFEEVIGFHTVNAFERVVEWQKPNEFKKALGIKNLRFADVVTDIVA
jgi:hypothetical protein